MIFATVAVGDLYIQHTLEHLQRFGKLGFDVHILTDRPDKFKEYRVHNYPNLIFSYMDKFLFSVMLARKYQTSVFFSDAKRLGFIESHVFDTLPPRTNITVRGVWEDVVPIWSEIRYKGKTWKPFRKFLLKNSIQPDNCPAYIEHFMYIPAGLDLYGVQKELETVKPVLEYVSTLGKNRYSGIGSGEGAGLGYALLKNYLPVDLFDKDLFGDID